MEIRQPPIPLRLRGDNRTLGTQKMNNNNSKEILIIDDNKNIRETLSLFLTKECYKTYISDGGEHQVLNLLNSKEFSLVITDLKLLEKKFGGIDILKIVKDSYPYTEVIIVTAYGSVENAVLAMKNGAYEYLTKPLQPEKVLFTVKRAIEKRELNLKIFNLEKEIERKYDLSNIIGSSSAIKKTLDLTKKCSSTDVNVLLYGESGTGKELVARAIHYNSSRRDKPFIVINCGALPENLQESELFGHVRGAFTGACYTKKGLLEESNLGTVFLDEISETSLSTQVKLLRFLQDGELRPVGANKPLYVNSRLISASNKNLLQLESFREDLYYRLNGIMVKLPPLRERKEDIHLLAEYFVKKYCVRFKRNQKKLSSKAISILTDYQWPGNVRELENVIQAAITFCPGDTITTKDLPFIHEKAETNDQQNLKAVELDLIIKKLNELNWNKQEVAEALGISLVTLWRKIKKYNLNPRLSIER